MTEPPIDTQDTPLLDSVRAEAKKAELMAAPPAGAEIAAPGVDANPYTLMQQAILSNSLDVAVMERLMDLEERYAAKEARKAFLIALADFQAEVDTVPKTRAVSDRHGQHMYNFASLDDIVRCVRPLLRKHGLTYSWDSTHEDKMLSVTCVVRHSAGHSESSSFAVPFSSGAPAMSDQQKVASALSYAKRYSLTSALGISVGEPDNDGAGDDGATDPLTDEEIGRVTELTSAMPEDRLSDFLRHMGVARLDDLTRGQYREAVNALQSWHREQRAKGGAS